MQIKCKEKMQIKWKENPKKKSNSNKMKIKCNRMRLQKFLNPCFAHSTENHYFSVK